MARSTMLVATADRALDETVDRTIMEPASKAVYINGGNDLAGVYGHDLDPAAAQSRPWNHPTTGWFVIELVATGPGGPRRR
jgi:hypothetical protein